MVRKKGCCCTQTTTCRETSPCKEYAIQICLGEDEGGCAEPPVFALVVGPGSTASVSLTKRYCAQDLRVYGVSGETYSPLDPGAFPDDPFDDDDAWDHPFEPDSTQFAHGRKITKTLVSFAGVDFTWQFHAGLCVWGWFALGVEIQVGKAATVVETGTAETPATLYLRQEPDDTEAVSVNMQLGIPDTVNWCPGQEDETIAFTVTIWRADGMPFDSMIDPDWPNDDGLVGPTPPPAHLDYLPFPTNCDVYDSSSCDELAWPPEMADPDEFSLAHTMLPVGVYQGLSATTDTLTVPTQTHGAKSGGDDPYLGYATASGDWEHRAGSIDVTIVDRECKPPPPGCTECQSLANASETFNGVPFACTGLTAVTVDEDYTGPEEAETYWRVHNAGSSTAGPWFTGTSALLTRTTTYYQFRLHCEDVGGTPRFMMHLWTRQTVYQERTNTNLPPVVPATEILVDTDTGWTDTGDANEFPSDLWTTNVVGCTIEWAVDSDWAYDDDEDECETVVAEGCCDDFITCFLEPENGAQYQHTVVRTPCPGPARDGSYSLTGDCTACLKPPTGTWQKATHYEGNRCYFPATAWTNIDSNHWPGYDLGNATALDPDGTISAPYSSTTLDSLTIQ